MELNFQTYLTAKSPHIPVKSAHAVIELANEGGTVPFIARYRKERTGNLDEVAIRSVLDAHETFNEIIKRKEFILGEIQSQGNLTDELKARIHASIELGDLEEIYRPFKKKKKTKATLAREAGLQPLADWIWALGHGELQDETSLEVKGKEFIRPAAGFITYELALKGAQDIIIEKVYNDPGLRNLVKHNFLEKGRVLSKRTKNFKPHSKYEMYAEFSETVRSLQEAKASHRYLAMRRGWNEGELTVTIEGDENEIISAFRSYVVSRPDSHAAAFLVEAAKSAYEVHLHPSISNEVHRVLKDKADKDAIAVFVENVRRLLLASPFGPKCVLGVDPGLRTGCKLALLDKQGNFISHTVLQVLGEGAEEKARGLFQDVLKQIKIEAVAVGNGTGGREAEIFLRKVLKDLGSEVPVVMISESGASVYSASDVAREEFPDLDLTVRGAISIARRLQDPLAELVKVDPKSIGVGQYQHDVSPSHLKKGLDEVVESCVNAVGVDLNTASVSLLSHVAGIGEGLAKNIVEHRKTQGLFQERSELMKIARFSSKSFEQAAGFLRVIGGRVPLDSTGVHPERYPAVRDMSVELGLTPSQLMGEGAKKLLPLREKWSTLVGEYTFDDIVKELEKPGRDPRDPFKVFAFRDDIFAPKDLKEGMICPGIVTNVTNFGAFVDIGVHQDGLVHISELAHKFVDDPRKVVNPGDQVKVRVLKFDTEKNQISLSMLLEPRPAAEPRPSRPAAEREPRQARPTPAGRDSRDRSQTPREDRPDRASHAGRPTDAAGADSRGDSQRPDRRPPPRGDRPGPRGPGSERFQARGSPDSRRPQHSSPQGDGANQNRGARPERDNRDQRGGHQGPRNDSRKSSTPFNNPFAALVNLDRDRK